MDTKIEKIKIGVIGLSENSGTAFVATNLARFISEIKGVRPSLLEVHPHNLYDSLSIEKNFSGRQFYSFFCGVKEDEAIRGKRNELFGVNWALRTPWSGQENLDLIKNLRLINNISGNVTISLLSKAQLKDDMTLLKDMELIILVIDPLPSKLLEGHEFLCSIRTMDTPVLYVINKMNKGVSKRDLLNYLKLKELYYIPLIEAEHIYSAEYSGKHIYDSICVRQAIKGSYSEIIKKIFEKL